MIKTPTIALLAGCLFLSAHSWAQVSVTPSTLTYTQNFDGLNVSADVTKAGTTAPLLWDGTNTPSSSATLWLNNNTYTGWTRQLKVDSATRTDKDYIGEFSSNTIRFGNMGNGGSYNTLTYPTTDRALGVLMQGATGACSFGVVFQIDSGVAISGVTIQYTGEQWFRAPTAETMHFQYKVLSTYNGETFLINDETGWTDVDSLDFSTLQTGTNQKLNGNLAANRATLSTTIFPTLSAGQFLAVRWKYDSDAAAAQAALAVDDLTVSFGPERGAIVVNSTSFVHTENFNTLPTFNAPDPVNTAVQAFTPLLWGANPSNVSGWNGTGWHRKRKLDEGKDISGVANFLQDNWGFANVGSDNSTDRALGSLGRFDKSVAFGVVLQAGAGVNGITNATISYRGEQWWNAADDQSRLDFQYKIRSAASGPLSSGTNILSDGADWVDVNALDFIAPDTGGAFMNDGNVIKTDLSLSFALNQTLDQGEYLVIRWLHAAKGDAAQYRSGATPASVPTDGLFVDDLSIALTALSADFKISAVSLAGNSLSMTASGLTSGSAYHLEYSPDLVTPFQDVTGSTFTATAATAALNVTVSGPRGFYRVSTGTAP